MAVFIKRYWPLIIVLTVLWAGIYVCLVQSMKWTGGRLVYALDDTYIHMAMAKNLSRYGVFGVTRYEFTSTSSSPLWLGLLLLSYFVFGVNDFSPFVMNVVFATASCCLAYFLLYESSKRSLYSLVVVLSVLLLTPLVTLVFIGIEHTLQILVVIAFAYLAARTLAKRDAAFSDYIPLLALSPVLTLTRYEGLFLLIPVAVLAGFRKKLPAAVGMLALGILPLFVYGLVSLHNGSFFVPVSVLLKANVPSPDLENLLRLFRLNGVKETVMNGHILMLVLAALGAFTFAVKKHKGIWHKAAILPALFAANAFLHMQYSDTGHFFRYEAYLVAFGLFTIGSSLGPAPPEKTRPKLGKGSIAYFVGLALFLLFAGWPLFTRAEEALLNTPRAPVNIYDQQFQIGKFLNEYYSGEAIAINDLGVINYLADIRCLDLYGLGTVEVALAKRQGRYDTAEIARLAREREVKIAVVYPFWYENYGGLPREWALVGRWKISGNVVCGSEEVSFYAVDPVEQFILFRNLLEFSPRLPERVEERGPIAGPAGRSYAGRRDRAICNR